MSTRIGASISVVVDVLRLFGVDVDFSSELLHYLLTSYSIICSYRAHHNGALTADMVHHMDNAQKNIPGVPPNNRNV